MQNKMQNKMMMPLNAMTVDVEEYFHVYALSEVLSKKDWDMLPQRALSSMDKLLALFDVYEIKASFYILGWFAQKHPQLIQKMAKAGHEIASHGYDHRRVDTFTKSEFKEDSHKAKSILEEISGQNIIGYRAPTFSLNEKTPWAYDVLKEMGFRYSSSLYPVKHDLYGDPNGQRIPFQPLGKSIDFYEIPMSTLRMFNKNIPISGGGYFRLLPYSIYKRLILRNQNSSAAPCIFYTHPWEIDAGQPKIEGLSFKSRFRHYHNLEGTYAKLEKLCKDFRWGRMDYIFLKDKG